MPYELIQSTDTLSHLSAALENAAWEQNSPQVRQWVNEKEARQSLKKGIETQLKRVSDLSKVQKFSELCKVPGSTAKDYLNKVVRYGNTNHAVLAIRFKGLNIAEPFVDLLAKDFIFNLENVQELLDITRNEFNLFKPKWLRVELTENKHSFWEHLNYQPDLRTLLGVIAELKEKPKPKRYHELALTQAIDISFYSKYKADYDEFNTNAGIMADEVHLSSQDDFQKLVDFGHTYQATIDGRWAGIIALSEGDFLGTKTWVVHEEFLTKEFRGHGFGAALQRHAIDRIDPSTHPLLIGTIHANNTPSLGTANRIGRTDIGGYWFLEL